MAKVEVTPHYFYTPITPGEFEQRAGDRMLSVPSERVLVALGCNGCTDRVCVNVDVSWGDSKGTYDAIGKSLDDLGIPARVVGHHNSKTIKGTCPENSVCGDNIQIALDIVQEDARIQPKPEPIVYRSTNGWPDLSRL